MIEPGIPVDEEERIAALLGTELLDSSDEERFDRYTRLVRKLFDIPIVLVSLVDRERQWFKSRQGLEARETPRNISFCGHAILREEIFIVEDATKDERFHDNPLVTGEPNIRFYAGYPLATSSGHRLGTLCMIDRKPRRLDNDDIATLTDIGEMVAGEIGALWMANVDETTGLSNRRAFNEVSARLLALCRRNGHAASLALVDMDDFKMINDNFGHSAGDQALCIFADALKEVFRESDFCARLGGDEFAVLLTGTDTEQARQAFSRLRHILAGENSSLPYEIKFSFGVVEWRPGGDETLGTLLEKADNLMYRQKQERRAATA